MPDLHKTYTITSPCSPGLGHFFWKVQAGLEDLLSRLTTPGRLAPQACLAIMHSGGIVCSMTEGRNRRLVHLLYLVSMAFKHMGLLLMFKNQDLSLKKADFWFLWNPERWDNFWAFIPRQHQLARGGKELPALRRRLCPWLPTALLSAFHSFSAPAWAPSVSSESGPKEAKGVSLAAFQRSCLDVKSVIHELFWE